MILDQYTSQRSQNTADSFSPLFAKYKALVYEKYYLDISCLDDRGSISITDQLNDISPAILVVEDNPDEWFITRWALLRRFADAQVNWSTNVNDVISYLDACQRSELDLPKIILVDLYLPSAEQGFALLKLLQSDSRYSSIPTFVISRSDNISDVNQAFEYSVDGYIVKPATYQNWVTKLDVLNAHWVK